MTLSTIKWICSTFNRMNESVNGWINIKLEAFRRIRSDLKKCGYIACPKPANPRGYVNGNRGVTHSSKLPPPLYCRNMYIYFSSQALKCILREWALNREKSCLHDFVLFYFVFLRDVFHSIIAIKACTLRRENIPTFLPGNRLTDLVADFPTSEKIFPQKEDTKMKVTLKPCTLKIVYYRKP